MKKSRPATAPMLRLGQTPPGNTRHRPSFGAPGHQHQPEERWLGVIDRAEQRPPSASLRPTTAKKRTCAKADRSGRASISDLEFIRESDVGESTQAISDNDLRRLVTSLPSRSGDGRSSFSSASGRVMSDGPEDVSALGVKRPTVLSKLLTAGSGSNVKYQNFKKQVVVENANIDATRICEIEAEFDSTSLPSGDLSSLPSTRTLKGMRQSPLFSLFSFYANLQQITSTGMGKNATFSDIELENATVSQSEFSKFVGDFFPSFDLKQSEIAVIFQRGNMGNTADDEIKRLNFHEFAECIVYFAMAFVQGGDAMDACTKISKVIGLDKPALLNRRIAEVGRTKKHFGAWFDSKQKQRAIAKDKWSNRDVNEDSLGSEEDLDWKATLSFSDLSHYGATRDETPDYIDRRRTVAERLAVMAQERVPEECIMMLESSGLRSATKWLSIRRPCFDLGRVVGDNTFRFRFRVKNTSGRAMTLHAHVENLPFVYIEYLPKPFAPG
mmetsp:Transcript_23874/g.60380  ORF Transcript_23874/g.60380 Transcript_23874/m.60380 type:complete len:498 (-) Transcript_23874:1693-3186(-)